jgi:hypothetical protein
MMLCVALLLGWAAGGGATDVVSMCAASTVRNDLVELLRRAKLLGPPASTARYCDFTTLPAAARSIHGGTSVLAVSAIGQPPLDLSAHGDALARLARAGSRLYVEFAQFSAAAARPAATSSHERVVVPPHSSLKSLDALTLLNPHAPRVVSPPPRRV